MEVPWNGFRRTLFKPASEAKNAGSQHGNYLRHEGFSLAAEHHALLLVEVAEVGVVEVFDEADGFAGAFHFGAELAADAREFVEAENGFFDGETDEALVVGEVADFVDA